MENNQEILPEIDFFKAQIVDVKDIPQADNGIPVTTGDKSGLRNFIVKALEGQNENKTFEVYSNAYDYKIGDEVYLQQTTELGYEPYVILNEKVRMPEIISSIVLFILFVILLFGKKGMKAILSLTLSFVIIFFLLIPMTLSGFNSILVASFISVVLLSSIMLITNGRNKITYSAILGCSISIFLTIILSYLTVEYTSITGKVDESWSYFNNYLNLNLNFSLIVIASMIIGVIGAVDDASITQASVVQQLKQTNPYLSNNEYFKRAMQVGQDHAGAMVNTLILAYTASSIPLLMMIYKSKIPLYILINQEIVATEIFRMTIGSIGLLLAIPLTTWIAVKLVDKEDTHSHIHSHSHVH